MYKMIQVVCVLALCAVPLTQALALLPQSSVDCSKVNFVSYNQANRGEDQGVNITFDDNLPPNFNSSRPTFILVPGYLANFRKPACQIIKNALLSVLDCNVVCMSYEVYSQDYMALVSNTPALAGCLDNAINYIKEKGVDNVTLVGHSAGAQICGNTKTKPPIIIALDPAGPLYDALPETERLNSNSAYYVYLLHSSTGLGTGLEEGKYNFYLNSATTQPCCNNVSTNVSDIVAQATSCPHLFSIYFLADAIKYPGDYTSRSCMTSADARAGLCLGPKTQINGLNLCTSFGFINSIVTGSGKCARIYG